MRLDRYYQQTQLTDETSAVPMGNIPSPFGGLLNAADAISDKHRETQARLKRLHQMGQVTQGLNDYDLWNADYFNKAALKTEGFTWDGYEEKAKERLSAIEGTIDDEVALLDFKAQSTRRFAENSIQVNQFKTNEFLKQSEDLINRRLEIGHDQFVSTPFDTEGRIKKWSETAALVSEQMKAVGKTEDEIKDFLTQKRQEWELDAMKYDLAKDPFLANENYKKGVYDIDVGDQGAKMEDLLDQSMDQRDYEAKRAEESLIRSNPSAWNPNTSSVRNPTYLQELKNIQKDEKFQQQQRAEMERRQYLEKQSQSWLNETYNQIRAGGISYDQLDARTQSGFEKGLISAEQRNSLLSGFKSSGLDMSNMMENMATGTGLDKKQSDLWMRSNLGMQKDERLLAFVRKNNIGQPNSEVPADQFVSGVKNQILNMKRVPVMINDFFEDVAGNRDLDPGTAQMAGALLKMIQTDESTRLYYQRDVDMNSKSVTLLDKFNQFMDTEQNPSKAFNRAMDIVFPQDPRVAKEREEDYEKNQRKAMTEHLETHQYKYREPIFGTSVFGAAVDSSWAGYISRPLMEIFGAGDRIPSEMEGDFQETFHDQYLLTGDASNSRKKALEHIDNTYGVTRFGNVFMKKPPEKYLIGKSGTGPEEERSALMLDELEKYLTEQNNKLFPESSGGDYFPTEIGTDLSMLDKNIGPSKFRLRLIPGTEKNVLPDYEVHRYDEYGILQYGFKINGAEVHKKISERVAERFKNQEPEENVFMKPPSFWNP